MHCDKFSVLNSLPQNNKQQTLNLSFIVDNEFTLIFGFANRWQPVVMNIYNPSQHVL